MDNRCKAFKCSIIRGGTSKGLFLSENELPPVGDERDKIILRLLGSPDLRQIDGLGGANSLTSKICIIGPSEREDADVDYTFGQVSVDKPIIDWQGNCGNLSSAVGLFAINNNYVKASEPTTTVRVYNTNTSKIINVIVPVSNGYAISEGEHRIPGVPGTGAKIIMEFLDPEGGVTGKVLPTGNSADIVETKDGRKFNISVVDAVTPVVYIKAEELGLNGTELPIEIEKRTDILSMMEEIRCIAAEMIGLVDNRDVATEKSPAFPKVGFVTRAKGYVNPEGIYIDENDVDIVARLGSMQKMHRAYMIGGAVSTGAASRIPGTIIWDALKEEARKGKTLRIGHPYGSMKVDVDLNEDKITKVCVDRTARVLMDGIAYIPESI
ncbi:PrpF domain-containing protein [Sedimentibacter sp.]|uniref:2-methylaconitate cis-trans isomerase PrpF family protein n=1 Tax=Sedimentibacter sp. TaxID=1960295 RepID=UPI0028ABD7E7|nr:PrpF domain-containing protein [Sedimentibacter sp.]